MRKQPLRSERALGQMTWRALGAALVINLLVALSADETALDRYVAAPDSNYRYQLLSSRENQGYRTHILEMVSQAWLTADEVDRTLWRHWLTIIQPDGVKKDTALLFIGGGRNGGQPPRKADGNMVKVAMMTRSVVAELGMTPNQPLTFKGDGKARSEDSLIAYTWDRYLRTGDDRWPARLPMTKGAVRALDTISSFCKSPAGGQLTIDKFVVAGGSKRGWTTWTTAVVDKRVIAIIPIVIDMLNVEPSFAHHFMAYGFYAPAVGDYVEMGIMEWQGTPEYRKLMKIVEPFEYRDRLTLPKFIINATGDQFFLPDSSQFYFDQLPGVKYLRYVPNAEHSLKETDALSTLAVCYGAVLSSAPLPQFNWTNEKGGAIRVTAKTKPQEGKLWWASNLEARDFRVDTIGRTWKSAPLADRGGGVFVGQVDTPEKGWTAYMVELTFGFKGGPAPFKFTSGVRVTPDVTAYDAPAPKAPSRRSE